MPASTMLHVYCAIMSFAVLVCFYYTTLFYIAITYTTTSLHMFIEATNIGEHKCLETQPLFRSCFETAFKLLRNDGAAEEGQISWYWPIEEEEEGRLNP